jgi:hypothetical protein
MISKDFSEVEARVAADPYKETLEQILKGAATPGERRVRKAVVLSEPYGNSGETR